MFRLPRPDGGASARERYDANIAALRVLRAIDRRPATDDERRVLCQYSGWGDTDVRRFGMDFGERPINELGELSLTDDERRGISKSSLSDHYTNWEVVGAVWRALQHLGLGDVVDPWILEPSCGVGHFFGLVPNLPTIDLAHLFGVESDPLAVRIARVLYPECRILADTIERAPLADSSFDVVVGSVPFGDYGGDDPRLPQRLRRQIHDYFVCRSIALLRPGGVAALVTSRWTMDKDLDDVRRWLVDRADLLGAIRLPCDAFAQAGTTMTSDILFLQRRETPQEGRPAVWLETVEVPYYHSRWRMDRRAPVNSYFVAHPAMVLGEWCHDDLNFGRASVAVRSRDGETRSIGDRIDEAAQRLPSGALRPRIVPGSAVRPTSPPPPAAGPPPAVAAAERLSTALRRLLRAQVDGTEIEVDAARRRLHVEYDAARKRWGALRAAEARADHPLRAAVDAPWWPLVASLEGDDGTQTPVFTERTVARVERRPTTDPVEALRVVLNESGRVDLRAVADCCGKSDADVAQALRGLVFQDGPAGEWLTAPQYLSGHVYDKLRRAREWAALDPSFVANVDALTAILPEAIPTHQVAVGLGASWVPPDVYNEFLRHLFPRYDGFGARFSYVEQTGTWLVDVTSRAVLQSVENTNTYGTAYFDGVDILRHAMTLRVPVAYDESPDGARRVRNDRETMLAQAKLADVREKWAQWIIDDAERASRLTDLYNAKFNVFRRREYDGSHLRFPGLASHLCGVPFVPHRHQVNGALRIVERGDVDDSVLLTYDVGGGKTLAIVLGIVKRLQLGLSTRACVVVPRHVLGQWAETFRWAFPAHVDWLLAATDGALDGPANWQRFFARAAAPGPRIVLLTYEQFRSIPLEPEIFEAYLRRESADIDDALADSASGTEEAQHLERTLRRRRASIERFCAKQQARWHKATDGTESSITWRTLAFDVLAFDEAHYLKNDTVNSKMEVAGMPRSESLRAFDARVKAHWLICTELFSGVDPPARVGKLIGATATPITNTLAELWVMLRLFQPRLLRRLGFWHFDAWAATFTVQWQSVEMDSVGKFRSQIRLKFQNVPEILDALSLCWDSAPDCLDVIRPSLAGGKMEVVETVGSEELRQYTAELASRAAAVRAGRVALEDDNMLLITHDGRCASLFNGRPDAGRWPIDRRTKIDAVADYVWDLYCRSDDDDGVVLVFCDLFTPRAESAAVDDAQQVQRTPQERWLEHGVYGVIVDRCVARGVLRSEIAYIHDAATDAERRVLFARVNRGEVRVLLGSTQKLGTGVNVQRRALAALHVTVPWRPDWLRQADGRVRRPGNLWSAVHSVAFPTTGSYDIVLWQMIQQKAEMIAAITSGTYASRTADDVGDMVVSASVAKAIALGDLRVLEKVKMETELALYQRAYKAWRSDRARLEWELRKIPDEVAEAERAAGELDEAVRWRDRHPLPAGGGFLVKMRMVMSDDWQAVSDRSVADKRVQVLAESLWHRGFARVGSEVMIGTYRGFSLSLAFEGGQASLVARPGDDGVEVEVSSREFPQCFATLEHRLADLESQAYRLRANARLKQARFDDLTRSAPAWRDLDKARALLSRYQELCAEIADGGIVDAQSYRFE